MITIILEHVVVQAQALGLTGPSVPQQTFVVKDEEIVIGTSNVKKD